MKIIIFVAQYLPEIFTIEKLRLQIKLLEKRMKQYKKPRRNHENQTVKEK